MVKFGKQLEAQLVQEWGSAYVDYRQLKRDIEVVRKALADSPSAKRLGSKKFTQQISRSVTTFQESVVSATGRAADFLKSRSSSRKARNEELLRVKRIDATQEGEYEEYRTQLSDAFGLVGAPCRVFFARLDGEFNKVNKFCMKKEKEFTAQYEILQEQVEALEEIRMILKHGGSYRRAEDAESDSDWPKTVSEAVHRATQRLASRQAAYFMNEGASSPESKVEMSELGSTREKYDTSSRGDGSDRSQMRLNIPLDTPGRTIKSVTQSFLEDVLKHGGSEGFSSDSQSGKEGNISVTKKNVRVAEKMLKAAFEEFYRGLGLLKNYWYAFPSGPRTFAQKIHLLVLHHNSDHRVGCNLLVADKMLWIIFSSLNAVSFGKILKKFDKVSGFRTLPIYIRAVETSHFTTSDTTISLLENVERLFAKTFAKDDESKARNHLRPANKKASHNVTFLLGLFTGGSIALFTIYAILLHAKLGRYLSGKSASGLPDEAQEKANYLRTIFPVFALSALIILHILMYGFNVYYWCKWRINYPFMFDMRQGTELRHREVLMAGSVLLCILLASMIGHLFLHDVSDSHYVDFVPLSVFMLLVGLLFFPFNEFKRSSRIFLIITFTRLAFAPLYKVLLKDFFLGDQLTSQVPMLRNLLFTLCYYSGGFFKSNNADGCLSDESYFAFTIIVSLVPYWWRFLQCIRRYVEEHDFHQMQNAGKYLSTAVAVALRIIYMRHSNVTWFVLHVVASIIATVYQTYWDLYVDWGLLREHSKNKWLRDKLIMPKAKYWYFLCMVVNVILRLAWVQSILRFRFGLRDFQVADFAFASMEVIRRGIWNFFRLENEHLNNVGKYRATKTVPLPFERLAPDEL